MNGFTYSLFSMHLLSDRILAEKKDYVCNFVISAGEPRHYIQSLSGLANPKLCVLNRVRVRCARILNDSLSRNRNPYR